MFVAATSCPVRRRALNTDAFQMTGSCSMVAASASRLDRAALKGTSWAAGSCSRATSARTAQVSVASCHVACVWHPVVPRTARPRSPFFSRVSVRRGGRLGLRRQSQTQRGAERHVRPGWRGGRGRGGWGWGRGFGRQESRGKVASVNSNSNFIYIVLFMQKKQTMQPKVLHRLNK